ncbi:hypothetical protein COCNU_11G001470 [Cocos nucifera]|uniref:Uncharacterized protein n=1 Tax=Cocos nucifera TaxID=13894 RepID=A0A8K0N9I6_COCNU|nr:hypothetical protein COCNU_11G001470 [Cocos nucifera]
MPFLLSSVSKGTSIGEILSRTSGPWLDIRMEIFVPPELLLEEDAEGRGTDSTGATNRTDVIAFASVDFSFLGVLAALEEPPTTGYARTASVRAYLGAMVVLIFLFFAIHRRVSRSNGSFDGEEIKKAIDPKGRDEPLPTNGLQNLVEDAEVESEDLAMNVANVVVGLGVEVATEMIFIVSPMLAVAKVIKNLPEMVVETMGVAELPYSISAVEVVELLGKEVSISGTQSAKLPIGVLQSFAPSTVDTVKFLKSHLSSTKKRALEGEVTQRRMTGALRFLTLISHYLANFAGVAFGVSSLELVEVKKEIDMLKYHLKQEKAVNANLIKEIDYSKKALFDA